MPQSGRRFLNQRSVHVLILHFPCKKIFAGSIAILKGIAVMFTRYIVKETKTANVNVEKKVDFLLNENKYGIV